MASIDNRVVSMQFDNASFERNVASTIQSLEKLKLSMNFGGVKTNLGDLNSAVQKVDLNPMSSAVDGISAKFLALSTIAVTTLATITTQAVQAGMRIAKSLTLDNVLTGFNEYELNIKSIQTILANTSTKGEDLTTVTKALDELNAYADKTIYNFAQMARNIGTFTAAGVDLDVSVNAIKGIANLAAVSGSDANQASMAMYQLSQAIASGTVKLMDWNSVVNAGMGGEVFQKALFETGKALGTLKDIPMDQSFEQWKEAGNSFRASLESGWITADVLTTTLSGFTGDLTEAQLTAMGYTEQQAAEIVKMGVVAQDAATKVKTLTGLIDTTKEAISSGWAQSFRIIVGDFDEAKSLFTGIADAVGEMVGKSTDARNELLQGWKDAGGRALLLYALKDAFVALQSIFEPFQKAFRTIFPKQTVLDLMLLTNSFREFTKSLIISEKTGHFLRRAITGIFAVLEIGWEIVKNVGRAIGELFSHFSGRGDGVLKTAAEFGDFFKELNKSLVDGEKIKEFFDDLIEAVKNPGKAIDELKDRFSALFEGINFGSLNGLIEALVRIKDKIIETIRGIDVDILNGVADFFDGIFDNFDPQLTNSVDGGLQRVGDRISWFKEILSKIGGVLSKIGDIFGWFWDRIIDGKEIVGNIISNLRDAFEGLGPALIEFFESENFDKVLDLIQTIIAGVFAGGFNRISKDGLGVNVDLTGGALTGLSDMFESITKVMPGVTRSLDSLSGTLQAMQTNLQADTLQKIAIAIGLLTASVLVLSMIDTEALAKAMGALAIGFGQLMGALAILTKITATPTGAASFGIVAGGMILLASAMVILSVAMKIFSTMSWEDIGKGLLSVTALLVGLTVAVNSMPNDGKLISSGLAIIAIAVGMGIFAVAMKIFATLSWEEIGKGLVSVAGGLAAMVAALNLMPADTALKAIGVLLIAAAMNLLATAMKIFATMSMEEIGRGLLSVAGGLIIIALAANMMPVTLPLIALGLVGIAFALNIMAGALKLFATMSWEDLGKSMAVLASALAILAIAVNLMSGAVGGALAIMIISLALTMLVTILKEFAKMKTKDLIKGLLGLAAVLGVLGLAAMLLQPVIPALLALGAALILVGAGLALFGLGASLAAAAFATFAAAGKAGIDTLLYLLDELLVRLPAMVEAFAVSIIQLITALLEQAPALIEAIVKVLGKLLEAIIKLAPQLAETIIALIDVILTVLVEKGPDIIAAGFNLLKNLLTGIRDNIGELVVLAADIIVNFLNGLASKIPDIVSAAVNLLVEFLKGISDNIGKVVTAGIDIVVSLIEGITQNIDDVGSAATELIVAFIEAIGEMVLRIVTAGKNVIIDFIYGIGQAAEDVVEAGVDTVLSFIEGLADNALELANGAAKVMTDFLNGLADAIRDNSEELRKAGINIASAIISGITFGISDKAGDVKDGFLSLAKGGLGAVTGFLGINSPSRAFIEVGESVIEGLVDGLKKSKPVIVAAEDIAGGLVDSFQTLLSDIPSRVGELEEFTPVITPVLDLGEVQKEAKKFATFFSFKDITPDLSYSEAATISFAEVERANRQEASDSTTSTSNISFEQNIYAPEPLTTSDIFRQTRSQIARAKEELAIP